MPSSARKFANRLIDVAAAPAARTTRDVIAAGCLLGIEIVDHLVIGVHAVGAASSRIIPPD